MSKYRYGQPTNRYLQDLNDQGLPVSPGMVAGGLQRLSALRSRIWTLVTTPPHKKPIDFAKT